MRLRIALALTLLSASSAFAVDAVTYKGTIGKIPVILEMAEGTESGSFAARYAYMSKGIDIPLHGTLDLDDGIKIEEEAPCDDKICKNADGDILEKPPIGADWTLESSADEQQLKGTWKDRKSGKSLPVMLTRVDSRSLGDSKGETVDDLDPSSAARDATSFVTPKDLPYDFLKLDHSLKKGKVTAIGDSAYRMDLDNRVGLDFPTVVKLGKVDPARLNRSLKDQRLRWVSVAFDCYSQAYLGYGWTDSEAQGTNGFDDGSAQVIVDYLTPRLMGITESGSQYCGGAHPDNFVTHILLDAKTGKPVTARDLLKDWVAKDVDGNLVDPAKVEDPTTLVWGPGDKLTQYVLGHRNESGASTDEDCPTADLVKTNLGVYFGGDKLIFALVDLPTVTVACGGDLSSIPIKDARPFLTKAGARYFAELDK